MGGNRMSDKTDLPPEAEAQRRRLQELLGLLNRVASNPMLSDLCVHVLANIEAELTRVDLVGAFGTLDVVGQVKDGHLSHIKVGWARSRQIQRGSVAQQRESS